MSWRPILVACPCHLSSQVYPFLAGVLPSLSSGVVPALACRCHLLPGQPAGQLGVLSSPSSGVVPALACHHLLSGQLGVPSSPSSGVVPALACGCRRRRRCSRLLPGQPNVQLGVAQSLLEESAQLLRGDELRRHRHVVLLAVGEDEADVTQQLRRRRVLKLVDLDADAGEVHRLADHVKVVRGLHTRHTRHERYTSIYTQHAAYLCQRDRTMTRALATRTIFWYQSTPKFSSIFNIDASL